MRYDKDVRIVTFLDVTQLYVTYRSNPDEQQMEADEEQAANKVEQLQQMIAKLNSSLSETSSRSEFKDDTSSREEITKENSELKSKVRFVPNKFILFICIYLIIQSFKHFKS